MNSKPKSIAWYRIREQELINKILDLQNEVDRLERENEKIKTYITETRKETF